MKVYLTRGAIFILLTILHLSCMTGIFDVPPEYYGNWETGTRLITVRFRSSNNPTQYISDSAIVKIQINQDKTVNGFIGSESFENGKLKKTFSLPWDKGIKYIIKCGPVGKIFGKDPWEEKEVEIWLGPVEENGMIKGSMRLNGTNFPMAGLAFKKEKD